MSKIDRYKTIKENNDHMIKNFNYALGNVDKPIDKNFVRINDIRHRSEPTMGFFSAQFGYVGNSQVTSVGDDYMVDYIRRAINAMMPQIVDKAIAMARADTEKARREAIEEANEVLREAGQDIPGRLTDG